jgi:hypothetical protein
MTLAFPEIYFVLDSGHVVLRLEETLRIEWGTMEVTQNKIYSTMACGNGGCHGSEGGDEWGCCMQRVEVEVREDDGTVVRDQAHTQRKKALWQI